jgi:hypothetical protein
MENQRCYRRQLGYFSKRGEVTPKDDAMAASSSFVQIT